MVTVDMFQFSGPVWGSGFDSDDLDWTPFGAITVRFPTCDTALFQIVTEVGLQNGDYALVRLTDFEGADCHESSAYNNPSGGAFRFLQYRNETGTDDHLFSDHLYE